MFNKKRIFIAVIFILLLFFMTTFAGGPEQNATIATRLVEFIDEYDNKTISKQKIEVGKDAKVPQDPYHENFVFIGWFLYEDQDIEITNFNNIRENLSVIAKYGADKNKNGIDDEKDSRFIVSFIDSFDNSILKTEEVLIGMDATAPQVSNRQDRTFIGWSGNYTNVRNNVEVSTVYSIDQRQTRVYTVTFIDNDTKNVISSVQVAEGLSATAPQPPKHDKRIFDHWSGNYTNIRSNITISAIYKDDINNNNIADDQERKYSVIYNKGIATSGEVPVDNNSYIENTNYKVLNNNSLKLDEAVFIGWSVENKQVLIEKDNNIILPGTTGKIANSNVILYAVFAKDENRNGTPDYEENKYTVTFQAGENGKLEGEVEYKDILTGLNFYDKVKVPTTVANEGYVFDKWTPLLPSKDTKVTENLTYEAVFAKDENGNKTPDYKEDKFQVTYNKNIATSGEVPVDSKQYLTNTNYTVLNNNNLSLENAAFIGWATKAKELLTKEDKSIIKPGETRTIKYTDVTLYAVFAKDENKNGIPDYEENKYIVTFKAGENGKLEGKTEYKDILTGLNFYDKVTVPTPIANEGYVFDKWTPLLPATGEKVTGNLTYEATFAKDENGNNIPDYKEDKYTITFKALENGKLEGKVEYKDILTDLNFYDKVKVPTPVANEGYIFDKWTPTLPGKDTKITENLAYEATFAKDENGNSIPDYKEDKYQVTYNKNIATSGEAPVDSKKYLTNTNYTVLNNNNLSLENAIFVGWTTEAKQLLTKKDNSIIKAGESRKIEETNVTLYAAFAKDENKNKTPDYEEQEYTVTFKNDDGTILKTEKVLVGLSATAPETPTKQKTAKFSYEFAGWDNSFDEINSDLTITATYTSTINKYTVTFKNYYNQVIKSETVEYGSKVEPPAVPNQIEIPEQNSVVDFTGWSSTSYEKVTKDLEIQAQYLRLASATTTLYQLPEYHIRQEEGGADGAYLGRTFTILVEVTIKDDQEGQLGTIMSNTKTGEETKLAVGKENIEKYLTEESLKIVKKLNADIYVLKYQKGGDQAGWHLDCQINKEDIALYRSGTNRLKIVTDLHTIKKVVRYKKSSSIFTLAETVYVKEKDGYYLTNEFGVNIENSTDRYRVYYDNNSYKDYYWKK